MNSEVPGKVIVASKEMSFVGIYLLAENQIYRPHGDAGRNGQKTPPDPNYSPSPLAGINIKLSVVGPKVEYLEGQMRFETVSFVNGLDRRAAATTLRRKSRRSGRKTKPSSYYY
ncbi:hypothetical protein N7444_001765 [Penicillium canescens]|nr:hypothetical protein N7444_001765 [Penicillium canescens]KAJ6174783.1 hypothetical protein N7485_004588 [Penicillium canescens]